MTVETKIIDVEPNDCPIAVVCAVCDREFFTTHRFVRRALKFRRKGYVVQFRCLPCQAMEMTPGRKEAA